MGRFLYSEDSPIERVYVQPPARRPKRYGFFGFLFDIIMLVLTSGFWIIWIFVREMRR